MMIHHRGTDLANGAQAKVGKILATNRSLGRRGQPIRNLARGHNPAPPTLAKPTTGKNHEVDRGAKFQPIWLAKTSAIRPNRPPGTWKILQWLNQAASNLASAIIWFLCLSKKFPID
ncbi:hypothetical protein GmHk_U060134 [Glycine max]|nr:hypothetical protein GmHk_U060134 [Glycine max]